MDPRRGIVSLTTDNAAFAVGDKLAYMDSGAGNDSKSISIEQVLNNFAGAGLARNGATLDIQNGTNGGIFVDTNDIAMNIHDLDAVAIAAGDTIAFADLSHAQDVTKKATTKQLGDVYVSSSSHLEIDNSSVITISADSVTNNELANIARGSIKVGGNSNAPTDLDAKTAGQMLIGDGTDINSVAITGDISITAAGAVSLTAGSIQAGNIERVRAVFKAGGAVSALAHGDVAKYLQGSNLSELHSGASNQGHVDTINAAGGLTVFLNGQRMTVDSNAGSAFNSGDLGADLYDCKLIWDSAIKLKFNYNLEADDIVELDCISAS